MKKIDDETNEWLDKAYSGTKEKLEGSSTYFGLISEGCKSDPLMALQLGMAILMNKPIAVVMVEDEPVPKALEHIAFYIGRVSRSDDDSMAKCVRDMTARLNDLGVK